MRRSPCKTNQGRSRRILRRWIVLDAKRLREVLDYDSETGVFTWKYRAEARVQWNACWVGKKAGCIGSRGYVNIYIDNKQYKAHRLVWLYVYGCWPEEEIDHKNLCRSDNRLDNLRLATRIQNCGNQTSYKNNKSGVKGIFWFQNRWCAQIQYQGQKCHLGRFRTPEEACRAYEQAAAEHFGVFARSA